MTSPPQPTANTPPQPRPARDPVQPVSEKQQVTRALVRVLQDTGYFRLVTEDQIIQPEAVPAEQRPAVVVMHERTRGVERLNQAAGRKWEARAEFVLDIQGLARSHGAQQGGYNLAATRDALVQKVLLTLANNPGLVVQLDEFGETTPHHHAINAFLGWDEETVPVLPPLTRTLVRVTVLYDESLELRESETWRAGEIEGGPLNGSEVTRAT